MVVRVNIALFAGLCLMLFGTLVQAEQADTQVHLRGVVMPAQKVKFSFAAPGIVTLIASGGAMVTKGEVLAKLDDKKARAMLEQSRAQLRSAKQELASANHQRDKSARLVAENILSAIALTEADFSVAMATERVAVAKAQLAVSKKAYEECTLVAPFDGAVVAKAISQGEWAKAGDPVLEFVNLSQLTLSIDIPPAMADGLSVGLTTAVLEGDVALGEARVKTIYPVIDPASGLRRIVWAITPNQGALLSGRYVSLADWHRNTASLGGK